MKDINYLLWKLSYFFHTNNYKCAWSPSFIDMGYISKMRFTTDVIYQAKNYVLVRFVPSVIDHNQGYKS